jgi:hypothetical protein
VGGMQDRPWGTIGTYSRGRGIMRVGGWGVTRVDGKRVGGWWVGGELQKWVGGELREWVGGEL